MVVKTSLGVVSQTALISKLQVSSLSRGRT